MQMDIEPSIQVFRATQLNVYSLSLSLSLSLLNDDF